VGLPYSEPDMNSTSSGGTPYGVSHHAGGEGTALLSEAEKRLAYAQGIRLAKIALKLANGNT
ncbi:MAG TPA: NAD(P)H-quinone oxidoreductase, partial [Rhodocyclaceae bacterium]|nr:NAD(P)H-quinone oxidoreductase [Rhodocyclaceae bacterium]